MNGNPLLGRMENALERLEEARVQAKEARESLDRVSVTATAKDHLLSVTADARGRVTGIKLHSTRYRSMAAAELAKALLETVQRAQEDAAEAKERALAPHLPEGLDLKAMTEGRSSLDDLLTAFTRGTLPGQQQG
ncbi:YbaB/EbfC family nucleoid-associated protein [Streptomyces benahoarensis]|uniref:YbaB/EbfC family nucleoid-associated protein n=1 Tax=Streptomyces benahoarensis TaxID=2595054 RepID=A0A553ZN60_9ACTN|nr:YbaB/EbfC family nucleoid-associated protein [Streptomyces benahoarensis]TSB42746.1 YbaB/EbfC family nucleoid-associated protein [Streptomyces benahoarensis]